LAETHLQLGLLNQKRSRYKDALAQLNSAYEIQQPLVDEDRSVTRHVSILVAIADAIVALYGEWSGELDNAEQLRKTALDLHKILASEHPGVVEYQQGLAKSHAGLALFYMGKGNYFAAEPHLQSAREILERLVSIQPDVPTHRGELAAVLHNLGMALNQCLRPDDATKAWEESAKVRRELVAQCPDELAYQFALAGTCNELGRVYSTASHWDESDKALREALELCERLVRDHGDNVEYRIQLATVTYNLGELGMSRGQPQDALDRFASAAQILQAQTESPEPSAWSCLLVRNSWYGQSRALCQLRRNDEAMQAWQRAVDVDGRCGQSSNRDLLFVWRSELLARGNDLAGATAVVDELATTAASDGTRLHNFALLCAGRLTALESDSVLQPDERARVTKHLVDAAIMFLRKAHLAGFFQSPWQVSFLQIDQRLRSLLDREDFKKLLEELNAQ
jgi:tetratricopeptide (TPR) repeat protein